MSVRRNPKSILIQKDDDKSFAWQRAAREAGIGELVPMSGTPMLMPWHLLRYRISIGRPSALVIRYLNDYPSLIRTLMRCATDSFTVFIAYLLQVQVFWICHNIDRESAQHYPWITWVRRAVVKSLAAKVFVTDPLLVKHCQETLRIPLAKIRHLSFGGITEQAAEVDRRTVALVDQVTQWVNTRKAASKKSLVGLWIGSPADKNFGGIEAITALLDCARQSEINLYFVIVGPLGEFCKRRSPSTFYKLLNEQNIFFADAEIQIPACLWPRIADFVWKPMDDISVSLTSYNAASAGLPLVVQEGTFICDFTREYRLGVCVSARRPSVDQLAARLHVWDPEGARAFLRGKTWETGARALFNEIP